MLVDNLYQCIDMEKTGGRLEKLIRESGYSVKDIQNLLRLSCPQPIYRWMKGQILPTVDHLYALARLFQVHMEDMLVPAEDDVTYDTVYSDECPKWNHILAYLRYVKGGIYERLDHS